MEMKQQIVNLCVEYLDLSVPKGLFRKHYQGWVEAFRFSPAKSRDPASLRDNLLMKLWAPPSEDWQNLGAPSYKWQNRPCARPKTSPSNVF